MCKKEEKKRLNEEVSRQKQKVDDDSIYVDQSSEGLSFKFFKIEQPPGCWRKLDDQTSLTLL